MKKLIMCKGLPGSGKTRWSREQKGYCRINKDDLRGMCHGGKWSKSNEQAIIMARNLMTADALDRGYSVIIDDTNFAPKHEADLREIASGHGAKFEIKDFTDVPIETCIERDLKRTASVGEQVIRRMYARYLQPKIEAPKYDPELPNAIICDLDGTLALFGDKSPYDRNYLEDDVNKPIETILDIIDTTVILVSGRSSAFREQTVQWLWQNKITYDKLFMRPEGDTRKDTIVKKEIYEREIKGKYNVSFVIDDRLSVCRLWRSLGVFVFNVNQDNIEF